MIRALAQESAWVSAHENVFVLGTWARVSWLAPWPKRRAAMVIQPRAQALFHDLAMARADGSLRSLLARLSRIDVLVIDDWAMSSLSEAETSGRSAKTSTPGPKPKSRALSGALDDPDLATAGLTLARTDRRSHTGRWHPRSARAQRPSH